MKRLLGLMVVLVLLLSAWTVGAQSNPLMIVMDGALYQWTGDSGQPATPYVACTPSEKIVSDISVSSDGRIAFLTEPQAVTDALGFGGGSGPLPTNVRICDGTNLTAIATQPDNFSYFNSDVPDVAIARSTPTWSPDGNALAWTTFTYSTGLLSLDVYNPQGEGQIISTRLDLPETMGSVAPPYITWANNGIYMFHGSLDEETFALVEEVFLFDGLGNLMFFNQLPPTDETRFVYDKFIVEDGDQEYVGLLYNDGVWELVDPSTGEAQPANGVGELYSKSDNTDISLLLTLDESQQYVWTAKNAAGIIIDVNGNQVAVPGVFPTSIDLSPDGQWVFQLFDGLYYWSMTASGFIDGTEAVTTGFSATAWSETAWRIHRDA